MKSIIRTFLILSLTLCVFGLKATSVEAQQCSSATDATTILNGSGYASCEGATADALRVLFFKLALCTSKPTITDDSACSYILDVPSAISADIEVGKESALFQGDISIPEGTYTHALMLIDTTIGVKFTYEFDVGNEQTDAFGDSGRYCWTNGDDITWGYPTSDFPLDCGAEPAPEYSFETFTAFGCEVDNCVSNSILNEETTTTFFDVYLLSDLNTLATVGLNGPFPTGDASYIWGVQTFKSPPKITANTQKVELGFKLSEGLNVNFAASGGNTCSGPDCVESVNVTGFAFTMAAE